MHCVASILVCTGRLIGRVFDVQTRLRKKRHPEKRKRRGICRPEVLLRARICEDRKERGCAQIWRIDADWSNRARLQHHDRPDHQWSFDFSVIDLSVTNSSVMSLCVTTGGAYARLTPVGTASCFRGSRNDKKIDDRKIHDREIRSIAESLVVCPTLARGILCTDVTVAAKPCSCLARKDLSSAVSVASAFICVLFFRELFGCGRWPRWVIRGSYSFHAGFNAFGRSI